MNAKQMEVVTSGLERLGVSPNTAAKFFLTRLAQTDPALAKVFGGVGSTACARLRLLAKAAAEERATAAVRKIARRWRPFPVGYRDYATIGAVMLWAVRKALGSGFTLAARDGWLAFHVRVVLLLRRPARIDIKWAA